jgi:LysR family transcriptional regulator, glycine cleavage system transcriptional activator
MVICMTRLPPLNALRCFDAAARHRSFSKAADDMHVTQSAVSHQIRLLEDWFGAKLFVRNGKEMCPTARGAELAEALTPAFRMMGEACRRAASSDGDEGFTIGVLPSVATIWLIPRLQSFFTAYPKIPLKIVYAIHGRPMALNDIDVGISWGTAPETTGIATALLPGTTVAVGHPSLVSQFPNGSATEQIAKTPLLHDDDKSGWKTFMGKLGIKNTGPIAGPIFEDFNLLRAAALAGQGLALCPKSLIDDDVAAGRLKILFGDVHIYDDHKYWLIEATRENQRNVASIQVFKTWLLAAANHNSVGSG